MQYQLPDGRIIHLTVEEFLDLTDQDIKDLMGLNVGYHAPINPFHRSVISTNNKPFKDEDASIDFQPEYDEPQHGASGEQEFPEDDFPDTNFTEEI